MKYGDVMLMSRRKRKRKKSLKQKRLLKQKAGINVPFNLQNSPRKYPGMQNRYYLKANIHNLIYKDAKFMNVKYQASNITACNFKKATLCGVDFVGCNLKKTNFSDASLKNVIFMNCNLKGTNFKNCKFENVYFIMTDISECVEMPEEYYYLNTYPEICIEGDLKEALVKLANIPESYKYHVLHVKKDKYNLWTIKILRDRYGDKIGKALKVFASKPKLKQLYTVHSYMMFIEKYLKV